MRSDEARGIARAISESSWDAVRGTAGFSHGVVAEASEQGRVLTVTHGDGQLAEIPNIGPTRMTEDQSVLLIMVGGELEQAQALTRSAWVSGPVHDTPF